MTTRTFEFSEGTSNKFWSISLDGSSHTVRYGRIGTAGQTSTADFPSESQARKSYDKLIAEKLKKGYVEKGSTEGVIAAVPAKAQGAPAPASPAVAEAQTRPTAPSAASIGAAASAKASSYSAGVRRVIDLDLAALSYVPARRGASTPLPPATPFDLNDCLERLRKKVRPRTYGWEWDFSQAVPSRALSPPEAEFWLAAMTYEHKSDLKPEACADELGKRSFTGQLPERLELGRRYLSPCVTPCLAALTTPEQLCQLLLDPSTGAGTERWSHNGFALRVGFRHFVLPHLNDDAIAHWRAAAKALWNPAAFPTDYYEAPGPAFYYGAMFGLQDEVRGLVATWPDDKYVSSSWDHTHYHRPQEIVCGAGPADEVAHQFRRLKLPTNSAFDIQTFLAVTETSALDVVARTIVNTGRKEDAEELLEALARVHAPEAAPFFLGIVVNSKAPRAARAWLESNLDETIVGLMPVAAGMGKLVAEATEFLNSVKRRGDSERIAAHLAAVPADVAAQIRAKVLDVTEERFEELDSTPDWWTSAFQQMPLRKQKPIDWIVPTDLPPVTLDGRSLNADHVAQLLGALQVSTLEAPHPLLPSLRAHADRDRLDAFCWKLFESWLADGAAAKNKWAFTAAGFLGADRTVLKLAPLIRAWPGESQHQRAVLGLEVLRTIGTDTALMQINGIAQKVKFKGLKERAVGCMDAIAISRGMSRAQLEDRIVPDCGLDERGERIFDFGPRQFRFVLGPELKPMIRYPEGTTKADLPKPGTKDDASKAAPAVAEWKLLKKQIADVAKIQGVRLEQAMVTGRRWNAAEFDKLIVRHPLMVHLARLLVWAAYDSSGAVTASFRVTEDQTLADVSDQPLTLPDNATVGVLHPMQVMEQPHLLEQWGQLFGDYEIVPPFPQLGRPVHRLTAEESAQPAMTHFASRARLPAQTLVFGLEKLGWQRGVPADAGWVGEHSKQFHGANVTAVINYEEGFSVGYWEGAGEQTIQRVFFVPGLYTPQMYPQHKNAMRLAEVNPIAVSEVIGDCELLLAKAK